MRTFEVNYTIDDIDDSFRVTGTNLITIKEDIENEIKVRNLDRKKNNCWSKEVNEYAN